MPIGVPESVIAYFLDYVEAGSVQEDWLTGYEQIVFAPMYAIPACWPTRNHHSTQSRPSRVPSIPEHTTIPTTDRSGSYPKGTSLHLLIGPGPNDYVLQHWSGNLFAFYPTGENALGITAATFNADASNTRAKSVTLEYYNTTGLGMFTRS